MAAYAQVLLIAIPFFLVLLTIEGIYGWAVNRPAFRSFDTISSLSSGITNTIKDILGLTIVIVSYTWMYDHIALMHIEATILVYVLSFIAIDLAGYTKHYMAHRFNYFWNEHVVHHSSEEYNLACALRQSISEFFSLKAFLLIPAALMGMPPEVIAVILPIQLFLQFWYHTRFIPKLGILEYLIITPSQHRVHHAINEIYLDKNLGQIFPWWDRMFGTFQEELDSEPCVYGTKKPAETWNPIVINFQHLGRLILDAWHTNDWLAKLTLWLKPLGWRPADVAAEFPIEVIEDPFSQVKYDTQASKTMHIWSWIQLILTHVFFVFMLINFVELSFNELFAYGVFLYLHIYAYTSLMDLNKSAWIVEAIKCGGGLYWIWKTQDWFGLNAYMDFGALLVGGYLIVSLIIVSLFVSKEVNKVKYES